MASGIKITITNDSEETLRLNDLYVSLDAGKSIEVQRSPADLTQMYDLQKLIADEKVSVAYEGAPELLDEYGNAWSAGGGGGGGGGSVYYQNQGPFTLGTPGGGYLQLFNPFLVPVSGKNWLFTATVTVYGQTDPQGTFAVNYVRPNGEAGSVVLYGPVGAVLSTTLVSTAQWEQEEAGSEIGSFTFQLALGSDAGVEGFATMTNYMDWLSAP